MTLSTAAKQLAISIGVYKPARAFHRVLHRSERRLLKAHKLLLRRFIYPRDLVFDVGANIGTRTEIFLSLGATVVAFEPQPICAQEVTARGNERLRVIQKAVGEREGTAELHLTHLHTHASFLPSWGGMDHSGVLTVPVTTLDKTIQEYGVPTFCKIDVEGYEPAVLRGLSHPIRTIAFEYMSDDPGVARTLECLHILSQLGDYRLNLTGQEEAIFLSPWLTISDFIATWLNPPEKIKRVSDCNRGEGWGDIVATLMPAT